MNKIFLIFVLTIIICATAQAQVNEYYVVASPTLTMRSGDSKDDTPVQTLSKNDAVLVLETNPDGLWIVDYNGIKGFVVSKFLKKRSNEGWIAKKYATGDVPDCEISKPQFDKNLENHLKITLNSSSDVLLKLIQIQEKGDVCIRTAYIQSGDILFLKNIPEGKYYLKLAYGKDWRQKKVGTKCTGRFIENAKYEIGNERLNFKLVQLSDRLDIPSYSLTLGSKANETVDKNFNTNHISETEFNN